MGRLSVGVHIGFLIDPNFHPNSDSVFGDYGTYLNDIEEFVKGNECIILTNPDAQAHYMRGENIIPFKVPKGTHVIVDSVMPVEDYEEFKTSYTGAYDLFELLEKKKVGKEEEIGLCGELLWRFDEPGMVQREKVLPGCVIYYYNALLKGGYSPRILRQFCYPTKDPSCGFKKNSLISNALKL
jgi:hypothetical protein